MGRKPGADRKIEYTVRAQSYEGWSAQLKYKYGINASDYEKVFTAQNGVCKLCDKHDTKYRLSVDHCHTTGRVRGLLCTRCNQALGVIDKHPDWVERVREYLREAETNRAGL